MNIIALSGGFYTGSSAVHQLISGCNDFFCLPCQYDEFDLVREPKRGLAAFVRCPTENVDSFVKYLSTDCVSSYKMICNLVHFSDSNKIIVAKLKYWRCIIRFFRRILTHESFFYFVSKLLGISAKYKYKLKKEFNQQDTIAGSNLLFCNFFGTKKENIDRSVYDINYSKSRIGLWKSYPNQQLMNRIASELKDYLYES